MSQFATDPIIHLFAPFRRTRPALLWLLVSAVITPLTSAVETRRWSPTDFGATADGATLNTTAFQRAIDAAHTAGGGTVAVPAGRYLTGTLELRSGVTLHLEKGAELLGSPHVADYRRGKWPALILATGQERIALTGEGTIDGQGKLVAQDTIRIFESGRLVNFFPGLSPGQTVNLGTDTTEGRTIDPHAMQRAGTLTSVVAQRSRADMTTWRVDENVRPQLIEFSHCHDVRVSGITLKNAANWVQSYRMCDNLEIAGVRVDSTSYWNNDGLDLVNCRSVRITDCDINAADDGICLKSEPNSEGRGCEDVVIANCRIRSSASAVKFGTASYDGFRRIRIYDIDIRDTYRSAIALESVDGAVIEDIEVNHVRARNTGNAFFLRLGQRNPAKPPGILRHVVLSDIEVEISAGKPDAGYEHEGPPLKFLANIMPASIVGLPDRPIEDVVLRNVTITYGGGAVRTRAEMPLNRLAEVPENRAGYPEFTMFGELPSWGFYLRHATGVRFENVTLQFTSPDFRSAIVADNLHGFAIDGLTIRSAGEEPVLVLSGVSGESWQNIEWPSGVREKIRRVPATAGPPER